MAETSVELISESDTPMMLNEQQGPFNFDFSELQEQGGVDRIGELNPYITLACDLRCDYCYMGTMLTKARDESQLMTALFLDGLIDHLVEDGGYLDRMTILGGEPTLHPDITSMINSAASKPIHELRMTTNGTSLHHLDLAGLEPGAFDHVSISIDGIDAETNDLTRGKGTFTKIIATMMAYAEAEIPLSVNFTVTRNNIKKLNRVPSFFRDLGVSIVNLHRASLSGTAMKQPELIADAEQWILHQNNLVAHIEANRGQYQGMKFRIPYTFLTADQMQALGYTPVQAGSYHSPEGGHRLLVMPPTELGRGLCYMSSDLINVPNCELGVINPRGKFTWNSHPNNELIAHSASGAPSDVSTILKRQVQFEGVDRSAYKRVSHSFKREIDLT